MPFRDGTGPLGAGRDSRFNRGRKFAGGRGTGVGGHCVCPNCKIKVPHQPGKPCYLVKCPKCRTQMVRE